MSKGQCFVLMPFGDPFDLYYEGILSPAIRDAGFEPKRADEIYKTGVIISDIFAEIRKSAILIADLSGKNPNVFYELGYAHAFRLPVVIIAQSLDDVPFDLRHQRVLLYKKEGSKWGGQLRTNLTLYLQEVIDKETTIEEREERRGHIEVYRFFKERPAPSILLSILRNADAGSEINLLAMSMTILDDPRLPDALERKLKDGCRVRILTLQPNNPNMVKLIAAIEEIDWKVLKSDLVNRDRIHKDLVRYRLDKHVGRIELCHYNSLPSYFIFMTNKTMIVGFYLRGKRGIFSPHVELRSRDSNAYREFAKNFDLLWDERVEARDPNKS